jgi:hypothetical protein
LPDIWNNTLMLVAGQPCNKSVVYYAYQSGFTKKSPRGQLRFIFTLLSAVASQNSDPYFGKAAL